MGIVSIFNIITGVLLVLLFTIVIISVCTAKMNESVLILLLTSILFIGVFNIGFGVKSFNDFKNTITPIEVYRGNTELKIETKLINGEVVSCDSIVVLK
jgi:hypothetical protein